MTHLHVYNMNNERLIEPQGHWATLLLHHFMIQVAESIFIHVFHFIPSKYLKEALDLYSGRSF